MKDRILAAVLAASCLALAWVLLRSPPADRGAQSAAADADGKYVSLPTTVQNHRPQAICNRPLADVDFDGKTFAQALDEISAQAHVSIVVMESPGMRIDFDTPSPARLHLRDTTVGKALAALIGASGKNFSQMEINVSGDRIVIEPLNWTAAPRYRTEVYNVRDLVRQGQKLGRSYHDALADIDDAITVHVANDGNWGFRYKGGIAVNAIAGLLMITETDKGHRAVAETLAKLRSEIKATPIGPPSTAPVGGSDHD